MDGATYPINLSVDYADGQRSRLLALTGIVFFMPKLLLLLPHFVVVGILGFVALIAVYVGYIVAAITGTLPEGIFRYAAGILAWGNRLSLWLYGLVDRYPPFAMRAPDHPAEFTFERPMSSSRGLAVLGIVLLKPLALLPHLIVLYVLQFVAQILAWVGFIVVLFTGSLPRGLFDFMLGYHRWNLRASAWLAGLVDRYPPFSLD